MKIYITQTLCEAKLNYECPFQEWANRMTNKYAKEKGVMYGPLRFKHY